jgi:hypothetical protein
VEVESVALDRCFVMHRRVGRCDALFGSVGIVAKRTDGAEKIFRPKEAGRPGGRR